MKVIFSRKGFDTSYGKGSSPILPNNDMLSFPIPVTEKEKGTNINKLQINNCSYSKAFKQLYPKRESYISHFDPDLNVLTKKNRHENWKGIFGQIGAASTHLQNEMIQIGDIFLFFGSFKSTFEYNNRLEFEKQHEFHAIFGYLQIGDIFNPKNDPDRNQYGTIYNEHPHFQNRDLIMYSNNAVYIATEEFENTKLPGSGIFKYNSKLRLSKEGYFKSYWELPLFFGHQNMVSISYHKDLKRQRKVKDKLILHTVGKGQDFVVSENIEVSKWVVDLITSSEFI